MMKKGGHMKRYVVCADILGFKALPQEIWEAVKDTLDITPGKIREEIKGESL